MFLGRNLCSPVVVGIGRFVSVGAGNYLRSEGVTVLERWSGQQQWEIKTMLFVAP